MISTLLFSMCVITSTRGPNLHWEMGNIKATVSFFPCLSDARIQNGYYGAVSYRSNLRKEWGTESFPMPLSRSSKGGVPLTSKPEERVRLNTSLRAIGYYVCRTWKCYSISFFMISLCRPSSETYPLTNPNVSLPDTHHLGESTNLPQFFVPHYQPSIMTRSLPHWLHSSTVKCLWVPALFAPPPK